ncbi:MAG: trypsin-like serine protease [Deltaproteobacteria bacterium]|nr:trypsin-like serine protease [Deltaproteobacteria bacterium]
MIAPDVVLTAAHCVGFGTAASSGHYGAFTIERGKGQSRSFEVDRYRSFGAAAGPTDVAILHLSDAVEPSLARPAPLAAARASEGDLVTVYGYGCTDRGSGSGHGTKRSYSYRFSASMNLCSGDSGGPLFVGTAGPVFALNSGYGDSSGDDYFGDVVRFAGEIERAAGQWGSNIPRASTTQPPTDPPPTMGVSPSCVGLWHAQGPLPWGYSWSSADLDLRTASLVGGTLSYALASSGETRRCTSQLEGCQWTGLTSAECFERYVSSENRTLSGAPSCSSTDHRFQVRCAGGQLTLTANYYNNPVSQLFYRAGPVPAAAPSPQPAPPATCVGTWHGIGPLPWGTEWHMADLTVSSMALASGTIVYANVTPVGSARSCTSSLEGCQWSGSNAAECFERHQSHTNYSTGSTPRCTSILDDRFRLQCDGNRMTLTGTTYNRALSLTLYRTP